MLLACAAIAVPDARAQKVPDVVVGPTVAEVAARAEAPIAEVTVFSDRARVRRRGHAALAAGTKAGGVAVVRFPDLPGGVFLDTVRVSVGSGRVLRVEATPIERERLAIAQATKLLDELDAANDHLAELGDRGAADEWEVALLGRLTPAMPVPEDKREGRKGLLVDVASWTRALDFISERAGAARARLARVADVRRALESRRDQVRADLLALNQGGFSDRAIQVVAVLEAAGAQSDVELEYFVPGARWKPAYDLNFAPGRGQLRVETAAMVEQATGEDWERAALSFSTAIPGRGIEAPELLTWTLGERSEFIPQLRPRRPPPVEPLLPVPQPMASATAARAVEAELVQQRLAQATQTPAPVNDQEVYMREKSAMEQTPRARRYARAIPFSQPSPSSAPGAPAAAPPAMARMDFDDSAEEAEAVSSRPASLKRARIASVTPMTTVPLALFDSGPARARPTFSDPYLPAVSAGGLDYVYQAPTPATVPSSGKQLRIPLAAQTFRASAFHEATPALATTAFLRARVRNDGKRPLLRGPATIFSDGELVGQGEIQTTGPGGDIEFPLGADQDIRLVRQVVPSTTTTGVIMKSEETTYDVQIQVGNYKKQRVTVEVIDQVPRSRRDKVEVKMLGADPGATAAPDADGVLRWRLDIAPATTRTIKLRYRITRPKGWTLYQQ